MEKSGLISVIVPIYGVEKYLPECIESLLRQTYPNLQIILVDDGSPDGCGAICDRYAQLDSRILALHQKNGGAAAARNAGLRIASGAYISLVDGDDCLEPDAYEHLLRASLDHDADIVHGQFRYLYQNGARLHEGSHEIASFTAPEYLLHFRDDWTCSLSTVKLFRRHTLANVFYEEGHYIDDEFFTYRGVMNANKIVYIPTVVYNYRQRASSVMNDRDTKTIEAKCDDIFAFLDKRRREVIDRFPELKALYNNYYAQYLLWLSTSDMATKNSVKTMKKLLVRHMACGRVLFWKQGQRKLFLQILSFLARRDAHLLAATEDKSKNREYQYFP